MTQPDPFSALLDAFADGKEAASKLHADLMRGEKAEALLAELAYALDGKASRIEVDFVMARVHSFLAASPAIPPGDGDA